MLSWEKDAFYAKQIHTQLKVRASFLESFSIISMQGRYSSWAGPPPSPQQHTQCLPERPMCPRVPCLFLSPTGAGGSGAGGGNSGASRS